MSEPAAETFAITLLLTEPVHASWKELTAAALEDFPGVAGWEVPAFLDALPLTLGDVAIGMVERQGAKISVAGYPGPVQADLSRALAGARGFADAARALRMHRSCCIFTVTPRSSALADRVMAVRDLAVFTAALAELPACTAVWLEHADRLISPKAWIEGAQMLVDGRFPTAEWIALRTTAPGAEFEGAEVFGAATQGLEFFTGREIHVAASPRPPLEILQMAVGMATMLVQGGHRFQDGDVISFEGREGELTRIRSHERERKLTLPLLEGYPPHDCWVLYPPDCAWDHEAHHGASAAAPAPAGVDNRRRADLDALRRMMGD